MATRKKRFGDIEKRVKAQLRKVKEKEAEEFLMERLREIEEARNVVDLLEKSYRKTLKRKI